MRRIKYIICFLLITLFVTLMIVPVNAYNYNLPNDFSPIEYSPITLDDNHSLSQKLTELYNYCDNVCSYYFIEVPEWTYHDMDMLPSGTSHLSYNPETSSDLIQSIERVYHEVYLLENDSNFTLSDDSLLSYYENIKVNASKMEINRSELLFLIQICEDENNANQYYDAYIWRDFINALHTAEQVYNDKQITEGITNTYWNLYFSFNHLCLKNAVSGDVDGDGEMTILDATLIQRGLAKLSELNAAQRCAACLLPDTMYKKSLYPSILDATKIQRLLVGLDSIVYSHTVDAELCKYQSYNVNPIVGYELYARMFPWYYE